jgi:hypothetical protein
MSPSPTKTPKSTKDRGLKAKSDGCSGNLKNHRRTRRGGLGGLFSGVKVCSIRNHRWEKTVSYVHRTMGTCMHP